MYTGKLKKGDRLEIEKEYEYGKRGIEIAKVVGIFQQGSARYALLDNGMKLFVLPPLPSNNQE